MSHYSGLLNVLPAVQRAAASGDSGEESKVLDLTRSDEGYASYLYDNRNGLPTSEANAIVQTAEGFIWIGCYSGLIRYDGNNFMRMDSTTGIASVVSLFVDSKNRLWVGTNDSGVAVIDKGKTQMFRMKDGLKSMSVRAITEDSKGNIYVATTRGVAVIDDGMIVRPLEDFQNASIRDVYVRQLVTGPDDIIYGVTKEGEVFTLDNGILSGFYNFNNAVDSDGAIIKSEDIATVYPDPEHAGYVYLGSRGCVYYCRLTNPTNEFVKIELNTLTRINEIIKISGVLWFCAENGIGFLDNGKLQILDYLAMKNVSVDHILGDYQGNLWFTSSRAGVMKLTRNRFADISQWCELEEMGVNTTCVYGNRLLIGTDGSGVAGLVVIEDMKVMKEWPINSARFSTGEPIRENDLIKMLEKSKIRSILSDSKGRLWFSTFSDYGLIRYDNGDVVCFTEAKVDEGTLAMPSERVRIVCEYDEDTILAACTGGLAIIQGDSVVKVYDENSFIHGVGLRNTELLTVEKGENGDIIIGTDGGGMYILNGDMAPRSISTENGLSSDVVMRVKHSKLRDLYWIVTSNSIAFMDADYNVTTVRCFPYPNNFDIYENSKEEVWILSSDGVYVTTIDTLVANGEIDPTHYNRDNGMPYVAQSNSYSALTENGDLYIAGSKGIARVNIESSFDDATELKAAVPYVTVDGVDIYPDEDGVFRVSSSAKKLVINSFVYAYSLINPLVTYELEGFDHSSTTVERTSLTSVSYTNLGGGTYYFTMMIQDDNGGKLQIRVQIVKSLAFYETWWFRVLVVILAIVLLSMLVMLYVKRKTQKLIEKEEEQRTFINEMTEAFAKTIDMKDSYTNGHSFRVAKYTTMLAEELGFGKDDVEKYHNIALLHDIGKIGVDDKVLNKAGKLDDDEFKQIKSHSALGYRVLKDISIMPELAIGAGAHHERPDGKGYPKGLKGDEIPRVAQIIAVADTFDAMYSDRPYRKRMNFEKAVSIIRDAAGTQLAADVVDAFLRLVDRGFFRAPDDEGGGTSEDIDNIHKSFARAQAIKEAHMPKPEGEAKAEEAASEAKEELKPAETPKE
ncbi:MAG: HD domain-containing protein [Lachnospiraceae bacterium]|nr:HD domain-containing protein [Lachnospiraceae bacterium]